jgi:hypothetical protein
MDRANRPQFSLRFVLLLITVCCSFASAVKAWPEEMLYLGLFPSAMIPPIAVIALFTWLSADRPTCLLSGIFGTLFGVILSPAVMNEPPDRNWVDTYRSVFLIISLPLAIGALLGCTLSVVLGRLIPSPPSS